jgi:hypothetical protein
MRVVRVVVVTALLAGSLLVGAPAARAEIRLVGYHCGGTEAVRCGWMHHDTTNSRVRGYADIKDRSPGGAAQVGIVSIRLYRGTSPSGPWTEVANGGVAGWGENYDKDSTGLAPVVQGRYYKVDYRWQFRKPGYSTNQVASSHVVNLPCGC